jgi:hypothetical protein
MTIDLKYLIEAIKALNEARYALADGSPEQRGSARAHCTISAINLEAILRDVPVTIRES